MLGGPSTRGRIVRKSPPLNKYARRNAKQIGGGRRREEERRREYYDALGRKRGGVVQKLWSWMKRLIER